MRTEWNREEYLLLHDAATSMLHYADEMTKSKQSLPLPLKKQFNRFKQRAAKVIADIETATDGLTADGLRIEGFDGKDD